MTDTLFGLDSAVQKATELGQSNMLISAPLVLGMAETIQRLQTTVDSLQEICSLEADADHLIQQPVPGDEKAGVNGVRKKPDTSKLTQYHFDFILYARNDWEQFNKSNPDNRKSLQDLVDAINARMGTDKSTRALARVWSGEISRDDLPVGKRTFTY